MPGKAGQTSPDEGNESPFSEQHHFPADSSQNCGHQPPSDHQHPNPGRSLFRFLSSRQSLNSLNPSGPHRRHRNFLQGLRRQSAARNDCEQGEGGETTEAENQSCPAQSVTHLADSNSSRNFATESASDVVGQENDDDSTRPRLPPIPPTSDLSSDLLHLTLEESDDPTPSPRIVSDRFLVKKVRFTPSTRSRSPELTSKQKWRRARAEMLANQPIPEPRWVYRSPLYARNFDDGYESDLERYNTRSRYRRRSMQRDRSGPETSPRRNGRHSPSENRRRTGRIRVLQQDHSPSLTALPALRNRSPTSPSSIGDSARQMDSGNQAHTTKKMMSPFSLRKTSWRKK
jgi:hypothetical protein